MQFPMPSRHLSATGKQVHTAETDVCAISGKRVCLANLVRSEMSGRLALANHACKCEITNASVFVAAHDKFIFWQEISLRSGRLFARFK